MCLWSPRACLLLHVSWRVCACPCAQVCACWCAQVCACAGKGSLSFLPWRTSGCSAPAPHPRRITSRLDRTGKAQRFPSSLHLGASFPGTSGQGQKGPGPLPILTLTTSALEDSVLSRFPFPSHPTPAIPSGGSCKYKCGVAATCKRREEVSGCMNEAGREWVNK